METQNKNIIPIAIVVAGAMLSAAIFYGPQSPSSKTPTTQNASVSALEEAVLPKAHVILPVAWGDLGAKLVNAGVIDGEKFKALYEGRGQFTNQYENLLYGIDNGKLTITEDNAGYLLNLFWALGLASKNEILEKGEMADPKYGGAGNFASTGGWTIVEGKVMDHYSRHIFFGLTPEQQALVDKVSRGIYRPCCGNSTHFPDCNHGMAMLGLLELMASQGVSEQDMWKTALTVNSYWFPDAYITIAAYMESKGVPWKDVNPQEILSASYSSAQGYAKIAALVTRPQQQRGGSGCGVDTGGSVVPQRQQSGCAI